MLAKATMLKNFTSASFTEEEFILTKNTLAYSYEPNVTQQTLAASADSNLIEALKEDLLWCSFE